MARAEQPGEQGREHRAKAMVSQATLQSSPAPVAPAFCKPGGEEGQGDAWTVPGCHNFAAALSGPEGPAAGEIMAGSRIGD